jgi:class 3 adenylate cyclase
MRQVMALFHRRIAEVIGGYQGIVARYMGDGVLAYFGYPQAHEDDAEQSIIMPSRAPKA